MVPPTPLTFGDVLTFLADFTTGQVPFTGSLSPCARCALVALGETELTRGQPQEARAPLTEAVLLRAKNGPQSWDLAEARERLGEALAASGDGGAGALLRRAASTLETQLGPNHPQTLRARRALQAIGT